MRLRRLEKTGEASGEMQARALENDLVGVVCWKEHNSSGVEKRPWRAGLEADDVAQVGERAAGCHSVIHSFTNILVYLLYARHCFELWENSREQKEVLAPVECTF